jgi:hypothetical protein
MMPSSAWPRLGSTASHPGFRSSKDVQSTGLETRPTGNFLNAARQTLGEGKLRVILTLFASHGDESTAVEHE